MDKDKILCPCYKVTKGEILEAVEQGASGYREIKQMTKAGKGCGKCKKKVKKFTKKLLDKKGRQQP